MPVLTKRFITDKKRTVITETSDPGQPVAGTIGQLMCNDEQSAKTFNCFMAMDVCQCTARPYAAVCYCNNMDIETLFGDAEKLLPLNTGDLLLIPSDDGETVQAQIENSITNMMLQVSMQGVLIESKIDRNKCVIKVERVNGCFSCLTGLHVKYACTSDKTDTLAHIVCGTDIVTTTMCTPDTYTGSFVVHINTAKIDKVCNVECSGGSTKFSLTGSANYVPHDRIGKISATLSTKPIDDQFGFNNVIDLMSANKIYSALVTCMLIGVIVVAIVVCGPIILSATPMMCSIFTRNRGRSKTD
jgi:hypothetical protein